MESDRPWIRALRADLPSAWPLASALGDSAFNTPSPACRGVQPVQGPAINPSDGPPIGQLSDNDRRRHRIGVHVAHVEGLRLMDVV